MSEPHGDQGRGLVCEHCQWRGDRSSLVSSLAHPDGVCPACWADGWKTAPRERMGALIEAFAPSEPSPRTRKRLIEMTEDEMATAARIARFASLHASSTVYVGTSIKNANQRGFDFMREEFKVEDGPYRREDERRRRKR